MRKQLIVELEEADLMVLLPTFIRTNVEFSVRTLEAAPLQVSGRYRMSEAQLREGVEKTRAAVAEYEKERAKADGAASAFLSVAGKRGGASAKRHYDGRTQRGANGLTSRETVLAYARKVGAAGFRGIDLAEPGAESGFVAKTLAQRAKEMVNEGTLRQMGPRGKYVLRVLEAVA